MDLADEAGYSAYHFSRMFRATLGLSPGRYLSAMRVAEAKRLLLTCTEPVIDVAAAVGFSSLSSFTRRFAASVGLPPGDLRHLADEVAEQPFASSRCALRSRGQAIRAPSTSRLTSTKQKSPAPASGWAGTRHPRRSGFRAQACWRSTSGTCSCPSAPAAPGFSGSLCRLAAIRTTISRHPHRSPPCTWLPSRPAVRSRSHSRARRDLPYRSCRLCPCCAAACSTEHVRTKTAHPPSVR